MKTIVSKSVITVTINVSALQILLASKNSLLSILGKSYEKVCPSTFDTCLRFCKLTRVWVTAQLPPSLSWPTHHSPSGLPRRLDAIHDTQVPPSRLLANPLSNRLDLHQLIDCHLVLFYKISAEIRVSPVYVLSSIGLYNIHGCYLVSCYFTRLSAC